MGKSPRGHRSNTRQSQQADLELHYVPRLLAELHRHQMHRLSRVSVFVGMACFPSFVPAVGAHQRPRRIHWSTSLDLFRPRVRPINCTASASRGHPFAKISTSDTPSTPGTPYCWEQDFRYRPRITTNCNRHAITALVTTGRRIRSRERCDWYSAIQSVFSTRSASATGRTGSLVRNSHSSCLCLPTLEIAASKRGSHKRLRFLPSVTGRHDLTKNARGSVRIKLPARQPRYLQVTG